MSMNIQLKNQTTILIDVVMVVYNRKEMVFETLPTLLDCPFIDQIIVVDNASSDHNKEEGPKQYPNVTWIFLSENEGCTAWNKGMAKVKNSYALILDDDCVPDISSLQAAGESIQKNPSVGLAAFNIINEYTKQSEWDQLEDIDGSQGWPNAIGACILARVEAYREVGGYKDFFLCFNDLELALSLWETGYRVVYDSQWIAIHKQKIIGTKKRRLYFEVRNLLWTIWGHLRVGPSIMISLKYIAGALYDARGFREYGLVVKGTRDGLRKGLSLRGEQRGDIPKKILVMLYRNFLFSGRVISPPTRFAR